MKTSLIFILAIISTGIAAQENLDYQMPSQEILELVAAPRDARRRPVRPAGGQHGVPVPFHLEQDGEDMPGFGEPFEVDDAGDELGDAHVRGVCVL